MSEVAGSFNTGVCKSPSGGVGLQFSSLQKPETLKIYKKYWYYAEFRLVLSTPNLWVFYHMTWTSQGGLAVDRVSCSQAHEIRSQDVACLPRISCDFALRQSKISNGAHHLCCWYVLLVVIVDNGFKISFIASVLWRVLHLLFLWCGATLNPSEVLCLEDSTQILMGFTSLVSSVLFGQKNGGSHFATQMMRSKRCTCQLIMAKLPFPLPSV